MIYVKKRLRDLLIIILLSNTYKKLQSLGNNIPNRCPNIRKATIYFKKRPEIFRAFTLNYTTYQTELHLYNLALQCTEQFTYRANEAGRNFIFSGSGYYVGDKGVKISSSNFTINTVIYSRIVCI